MTFTVMMKFVDNNLSGLIAVVSILSMLGCLLIMFTYYAYKDTRTTPRCLVLYLSIADFFTAFGSIIAVFYGKPGARNIGCILQSFITTTGLMSSFLWTMTLAIYLYFCLVKENTDTIERFLFPRIHLICSILPMIINIVAMCLGKLGSNSDLVSSGWCWIKYNSSSDSIDEQKDAIMWMFVDGKAMEIITYATIFSLYLHIKFFIRQKVRSCKGASEIELGDTAFKAARTFDRKIIFIPIVLIILRIWGTIRFFILIGIVNGSFTYGTTLTSLDKVLLTFQAIGDNFIGAANCIIFCFFSPKIMNHLKQSINNMWNKYFSQHRTVVLTEKTHLFTVSIS